MCCCILEKNGKKKPQTILKFQEKQACCIIFWTQNCYFMLQNHKTKNQLVFLTMSTSFVTLFWIEFFTNFFTNKNKSYKSVCFFWHCKLSLRVYLFWSFTSNCRVWFTGWCFFCLIQLMERATFRIIINVGQLSLSAQICVLTKILSGIQQFLKCHFTAYSEIRQRYSMNLILFVKIWIIIPDKILWKRSFVQWQQFLYSEQNCPLS